MTCRTLRYKSIQDGQLVAAPPGDTSLTYIEIIGIPPAIPEPRIRRVLDGLVIWPWPTRPVSWGAIADLPQGSVVRDLA